MNEEILRRAEKLLRFNKNNATEHECANAAALLKRMMQKYQFTLADIGQGTSGEGMTERSLLLRRRVERWQIDFANALATPFDCRPMLQTSVRGKDIIIIGHESDVWAVERLWCRLVPALRRQGASVGRAAGRDGHLLAKFVRSYMTGAAGRIFKRLTDARANADTPATADERAVVLVREREVGAWMERQYPDLTQYRHGRRQLDTLGLQAGRAAGERAHLGEEIAGDTLTERKRLGCAIDPDAAR
jgi:hypothetical protein